MWQGNGAKERQTLEESPSRKDRQQYNMARNPSKGYLVQIKHLQGWDGVDEGEPVVSLLTAGVALQCNTHSHKP